MSDIYLQITETPTVVTLSAPVISGALSSTVTVANTVTVALDANSLSALENVTVTVGAAITGTVTVGNSVTISSLPAITGTVTAGGRWYDGANYQPRPFLVTEDGALETISVLVQPIPAGTNRIGVVTIGGGTVTIGAGTAQIGSVTASISGTVPISISSVTVGNSVTIGSLPAISGTVTANIGNPSDIIGGGYNNLEEFAASGGISVNLETNFVNNALPISGTVTANSSNGSLTTQFGSVTTANTAFATSAVTNANRKYLLIQNITTAANVITVGIGFTPTTTQGIQLFAGAGLTFEGSYIPTGAVNLLSSVTASCYTILEA